MPIVSITTTAVDVFFGSPRLTSLGFKNGASAGIIYLRYKPQSNAVVSSTDYETSLRAGAGATFSAAVDGNGIIETASGCNADSLVAPRRCCADCAVRNRGFADMRTM